MINPSHGVYESQKKEFLDEVRRVFEKYDRVDSYLYELSIIKPTLRETKQGLLCLVDCLCSSDYFKEPKSESFPELEDFRKAIRKIDRSLDNALSYENISRLKRLHPLKYEKAIHELFHAELSRQ